MHLAPASGLLLALAATGCTTHYAYQFQATGPGVQVAASPGARDTFEDAAVRAELAIQGDQVLLDLTNKTDEVLQVTWNKIVLDRGDGTTSRLRPAQDLGWLAAGAQAQTALVPLALPTAGAAAAAYDGRTLELQVPVLVKREPVMYRFHFVAHVHAL